MPFLILRDDITRIRCDAVVNAANSTLLGGGGVDGAIHAAAGPGLLEYCARLGGCPTGKAKITPGFDMPCKYIIHTVGPIWHGGAENEEAYLRSCYRESLALAAAHGCESVAFPMISAGVFGYPKEEALRVAVDEIGRFLLSHEMYVMLIVHSKGSFRVSRELVDDIVRYLDDVYREPSYPGGGATVFSIPEEGARPEAKPVEPPLPQKYSPPARRSTLFGAPMEGFGRPSPPPKANGLNHRPAEARKEPAAAGTPIGLAVDLDESFSQMLLRLIDERGLKDSEVYKRANIDRKLFSKIRGDPYYHPSKPTAIAFAIALRLSLKETEELLRKAGFALSHSYRFDVIIEYFLKRRVYDIYEINELLFEFDQPLLGA